MRHKNLYRIAGFVLFCLGVSSPLLAADYHFVRIDFPNSTYTDVRGINARGDMVGGYDDADGIRHGFLLRNGVFTRIDVPNAAVTSYARAINARGDIVGNFLDADSAGHAFLLRDGQFTQVNYPGATRTAGFGINNAGDITGLHIDEMDNVKGFILKDGVFDSVRVPASFETHVYFAQDNGCVLVGQTSLPPDGGFHGYIRTGTAHFELIDFPGTSIPCTGARWINQRGDIVGFFSFVDSIDACTGDLSHGFLLRNGRYTRIDVPGSSNTKVFAINDDGVLVGSFTDSGGNGHGFKATPNHGRGETGSEKPGKLP